MTNQTWYEIQYSPRGEDDWFSFDGSYDTIESARKKLATRDTHASAFEFRIVKVTRTEEAAA